MPIYMWMILLLIIIQRLLELRIAKRNEAWLKQRGGVEKGEDHYKWFIIVHTLFFVSLLAEALLNNQQTFKFNYLLFLLFLLTQIGRIWCITSLGKFWNTKIIISPQFSLVKEGPYKYVKHPNYIIVGIELMVIPFLFNAYITGIVFPILHILLLTIRIPAEEKALLELKK
ncbi:isoprenylcysteine carboxyl methyltransferase family protein [Virgibacillus proomii]|jgi:methyltransferase|uniref:isoprenylcysteine carboxyl methyltransferase family protein n=1 Tax=Virgibacillus proomii TaxID=84407 RepID=UPI000986D122|nr:isoprenylcysteine carboxylmethyltransferase family protein [Virgibacillus proomii]